MNSPPHRTETETVNPPMDLRYRVADAVNNRLKAIPGLHPLIKSTVLFLRRLKAGFVNHKPQGPGEVTAADAITEQPVPLTMTSVATAGSRVAVVENPIRTGSEQIVAVGKEERNIAQLGQCTELPIPPLEMRKLVGPTETERFENPTGRILFPELPDAAVYEEVFDFGCGCGRIARQLIQQCPRPRRYLGIDLHLGMIQWCQRNLQPAAPNFEFVHHDVFNLGFNPGEGKPRMAPFPARDAEFTLVNALSVFTHLTEDQARYYLSECARVLRPDGVLRSSWFLFDKADFPMMADANNALYMQYVDPSAAVLYDRNWLKQTARTHGLRLFDAMPPSVKGHQWLLLMTRNPGAMEIEIPPDPAPRGTLKEDRGPMVAGAFPYSPRTLGDPQS